MIFGLGYVGLTLGLVLSDNGFTVIGYDKTAELAYEAYESNKTIRELLSEKSILSDNEIDEILIPIKMTKPSK